MRISYYIIIAGLLLPVAGCVSNKEMDKNSALAAASNRPVNCQAGADCDEKWRRAQRWIKTNATYEVITGTDSLIETAGPSGLTDEHLGFTVIKKTSPRKFFSAQDTTATPPDQPPISDVYDIILISRCNNWLGCTPSPLEAKASFNDFVIGSPLAPKPVLGVKVTPVTPEMAQKMQIPGGQGLAVMNIAPRSLAEKSGLSEGDIILRYDSVPMLTEETLTNMVSNTQPGRQVKMDIIRGRVPQVITIDFGPAATEKQFP